jgi:hypothetical protein
MDGPTFLAQKARSAHAAIPVVIFSSSPSIRLEGFGDVVSVVPKRDGIEGCSRRFDAQRALRRFGPRPPEDFLSSESMDDCVRGVLDGLAPLTDLYVRLLVKMDPRLRTPAPALREQLAFSLRLVRDPAQSRRGAGGAEAARRDRRASRLRSGGARRPAAKECRWRALPLRPTSPGRFPWPGSSAAPRHSNGRCPLSSSPLPLCLISTTDGARARRERRLPYGEKSTVRCSASVTKS